MVLIHLVKPPPKDRRDAARGLGCSQEQAVHFSNRVQRGRRKSSRAAGDSLSPSEDVNGECQSGEKASQHEAWPKPETFSLTSDQEQATHNLDITPGKGLAKRQGCTGLPVPAAPQAAPCQPAALCWRSHIFLDSPSRSQEWEISPLPWGVQCCQQEGMGCRGPQDK